MLAIYQSDSCEKEEENQNGECPQAENTNMQSLMELVKKAHPFMTDVEITELLGEPSDIPELLEVEYCFVCDERSRYATE